jgi:DNA-binding MarR family transcriptional regulator
MTVIVGLSSAGKGTAATQTKLLTRCINKALLDLKLPVPIYADGPMSTGEGLAWLLRDESKDLDKDNNPKFEGVDDKRAMIVEEEFSACLKATKRDGNTFSAAIRRFYDDGCYSPIVKTAKATCTHADLSFCGHITPSELLKEIDPQEFYNGFANRILWFYVPHSEIVPIPLSPSDSALQAFTDEIVQAIQYSHHQTNLTLSDESIRLWENVAKRLGKARNQMLGERARPNVLRIATIYALLDKTNQVQPEHLKAAIALWEYNQQSINYIFEMQQDDRELDISRVLTGRELSISEIRLTAFNQNISSSDLGQLLKRMEGRGLIERFERPNVTGKGKKATCFRLKAVKE